MTNEEAKSALAEAEAKAARQSRIECVAKTHAEMAYAAGFESEALPIGAMRFISWRIRNFDDSGEDSIWYAKAYRAQMRTCIQEGK
jgi:hypothetical protein